MRSIRKWAYEVFKNDRALTFIAMVTPEDLNGKYDIQKHFNKIEMFYYEF